MVSNAKEDLPEPDSPVITTNLPRGISRLIFLRLCSRAPRTDINSLIKLNDYTGFYRIFLGFSSHDKEYKFKFFNLLDIFTIK